MPFLLIRNDITKMKTDAIVNPANEKLQMGSGTSRAIYEAAGVKELTEACSKFSGVKVGEAVITKGFALSAKYIIHAVGSFYEKDSSQSAELLYQTYYHAMELAKQYDLNSIAFPLLSSGYYHYPKEEALKTAISAISDFLMKEDLLVYLVLYDKESLAVSHRLFVSVKEYIDDHYVSEVEQYYVEELSNTPQFQDRTCQFMVEKRSLNDWLQELSETFSERLLRLIDERKLTDPYVYKKANIDKKLFNKIKNHKDYQPKKQTVLAFAIALELSLDETKDLLKTAGYALSNSSRFDLVVEYFISNQNYNIFEINEVLFQLDEKVFG